MIEAGDIAAFIDNVIIEIEIEKGYNNIVKEVLRRITKNDLFVGPGKCLWKVREVEFLEVVIGPDRVKMKKEKV